MAETSAIVDVAGIERDLASMWAGASDDSGGGDGAGLIRACTLNLVVYVTPEDDREHLEEVLEEVNEHNPGRTLILVVRRDARAATLDAYVSMRCRVVGDSGKQICGEQVTIEAGGPLVDTAATVVAPLLVPDVPVYLWWKDLPHREDRLFDRLSTMADRVIIDSAAFDQPREDLLRLTDLIGRKSQPLRVSDLNWGRLTAWRTLLASFWDVPDYRRWLAAIDQVEIAYRPGAHAPAEIAAKALLVAGWLGSRLGWQLDDGVLHADGAGAASCRLRAGATPIAVTLRRDTSSGRADGRLSAVALSCQGGAARFSVALSADGAKLATEATIGGDRSVGRLIDYPQKSEAESVSRELAFTSRDAIYEAAVAQAASYIR